MAKSINDVLNLIKENDIKMVDFKMVDINGQFRHVTIPAENFSEEQAKALYDFQAEQLKLLGINMNLAPVVEVSDSFNEKFLDTRTFGTLDDVKKYGEISINSYESHGIATVLKHFPGNSNVDPHTGLPQLFINQKNSDFYLKPFEILLNKSSCVLLSHAIVNITDNSVENYKAMP